MEWCGAERSEEGVGDVRGGSGCGVWSEWSEGRRCGGEGAGRGRREWAGGEIGVELCVCVMK